jgi:hypothetical protein
MIRDIRISRVERTQAADVSAWLTDTMDCMRPVTETAIEVMNPLASVDLEDVVQLSAQISMIDLVERNCVCGCPSFRPAIDRSVALALVEEERDGGVPRTVIWFADAEGYIANVECV